MKYQALFIFLLISRFCGAQSNSSFQYTSENLFDPSADVILVAAHRGMHINFPENSLKSIEDAILHNIDIVEVDVRLTKDGIPILIHDKKVDRTTTGSGKVKDLTYQEICEFSLLDSAGMPTEFQVPSLAEALDFGKNQVVFDIDLKVKSRHIKKVAQVIEECEAVNSVFFYDSRYAVMRKIAKYLPSAMRMTKVNPNRRAIKRAMVSVNPDIVHLGNSESQRESSFIEKMQGKYRKPVFANALGKLDKALEVSPDTLNYFINKRINIIQTDKPDVVLEYLIANGRHIKI
ncbi:glycerophosphodiester phosphodiesterase family protein [Zunongwangia endophytica]|uniref:Glycerophosphodiester phosphodiesterase family protein n=1 Tax=Zunongwangia endophytica TaxID=1808945 RepID=A0ABV8H8X5_9FLAO|nr:glycerophosphodiester phosphodiesterase family protein [Zunongwangia endophytica]MDN3595089.1 glycerophosphodiester phosphodiesterase family protein [Zunongwangia endophytica]